MKYPRRLLATLLAVAVAVPALAWAADAKISALTALSAPASGDLAIVVDVSDTTMGSSGTDKQLTLGNLATFVSSAAQIAESQVTNLVSDLAAKAPLASPTFTGSPTVPTASPGTNTTQAASTAFVTAAVAAGGGGGGSGTVTSVAMTVPTGLSVSGSPVTTSGTLAITTSLSGIVKGNGSGLVVATAGTDYLAPSGSGASLTGITESQITNLSSDLTSITGRLTTLESATVTEVSVTTTTSLSSSAFGKVHVLTGSSYTVTLPTAASHAGQEIGFRAGNGLTGFVTLATTGGQTIDLASTRMIYAGELATLRSDGSNWVKSGGKTVPLVCWIRRSSNQTINDTNIDYILFNQTDADNSGQMADLANHAIVVKRPGLYRVECGVFMNTLSANAWIQAFMTKNLTPFDEIDAPGTSGHFFSYSGILEANLAAGDSITLQVGQTSGAAQAAFGSTNSVAMKLRLYELPQW